MSTSPAGSFHVVPPPVPRRRQWSEPVIAVALALFLNLVLILPFLLPNPAPDRPAEPPAIAVDLVPEDEAPPPVPPQPPEEPKPLERRTFTRSGGETDTAPGTDAADEAPPTESEPDLQPIERKEETSSFDIPDWARTVEPGYAVPAPPGVVRSSGGDPYLNMMLARVQANLVYPASAGGRSGTVRLTLKLHRDGSVSNVRLLQSAGHPDLDRAVYEALQRSLPFAPIPPEIREDVVSLSGVIPVRP